MKPKLLSLIGGIFLGIGVTLLLNLWTKTNGKQLEALPTPYYSVLFENESIRIVEHILKPGETEPMHNHPEMYVYFLENADVTTVGPDGKEKLESLKKGQHFLAPALTHSITNSEDKALRSILIELK